MLELIVERVQRSKPTLHQSLGTLRGGRHELIVDLDHGFGLIEPFKLSEGRQGGLRLEHLIPVFDGTVVKAHFLDITEGIPSMIDTWLHLQPHASAPVARRDDHALDFSEDNLLCVLLEDGLKLRR